MERTHPFQKGLQYVSVCSLKNQVMGPHLKDTSGFFVDHSRNTLDTSTAGKTANIRLCDTLDVISQNLAMSHRAALAQTLSALA
jgi:hypothetical protein